MKRKIMSLLLVLLLIASVFFQFPVRVSAANDDVDLFAQEYLYAVESHYSEYLITTNSTDMDGLLDALFRRYPVLYHYYDGCSWLMYEDYSEVTMRLKNTWDPVEDLWVIDSDEEFFAVFGLGLAELRESIKFITANGYIPTEQTIDAVVNELHHNYHLAYMGYHGWSNSYVYDDEMGIRDYIFTYDYFYGQSPATIQQWRTETEKVALQLAGSLFAQDMPDYEKVLRIHDWIINKTTYNTANMEEVGNHVAYGAMVKGSCVCMGYAEAMILLCQAAGVECAYVSGMGTNSDGDTESHAWNAIKQGGEWYMVDTTWDDPTTDDGSALLRYDYFNLTSAQLAQNHEWDQSAFPVCNGTYYNYETVANLSANDTNVYTQYDTSVLMTQEKARNYFLSILANTDMNLPGASVPETQPVTEPETQPAVPTQPQPQATTEPAPKPTGSVRPGNEKNPPTEQEDGVSVILIVAIVVVVLGAGAFVAVKVMEEQKRKSRHRHSYSATDFDDLNW